MILSTITTEPTPAPPMRWDIAQLVINRDNGRVILTNGVHDPKDGTFEGQVVQEGINGGHHVGEFNTSWMKSLYERLPENQTVKLQNV